MPKRIMRRFQMQEISSVDSPAQKGARALLIKRDSSEDGDELFAKARTVLVTSVTNGHAHAIYVWPEDGLGGSTMNASEPDEDGSHDHVWTLDPKTGKISIAENRGHTHKVDAASVFQMLVATAKNLNYQGAAPEDEEKRRKRQKTAMAGGDFPIEDQEDLELAVKAICLAGELPAHALAHLRKREQELGLAGKDSPLDALAEMGYSFESNSDPDGGRDMDKELQGKLEKAESRASVAEALSKSLLELSAQEFGHYQSLNEAGRARFLALGKADRDAELEAVEKANAVVYTDSKGREYRKNADPLLIELAKERDADVKEKQEALEKAADADLEKRAAADVPNLPGEAKVQKAILKALDGIKDEETRKAAIDAVKAGSSALGGSFQRRGTSATPVSKTGSVTDGQSPSDQLDAMVAQIAKAENIDEAAAFTKALETPEGAQLYGQMVE